MSIDSILSQTSQTFVRPYLIIVECTLNTVPIIVHSETNTGNSVLVKTTTLPSTTIGNVELPYQGRKINIPGDRAAPADLSMTIIYNQNSAYNLHKKFHDAMNAVQPSDETGVAHMDLINNTMVIGVKDPEAPTESSLHEYKLFGVIPTNIGAVEVSHETTDALVTFDVTLQYTYHEFYDKTP